MPASAQIYYTGTMTGWADPGTGSKVAETGDNCYYFQVAATDQFKMSSKKASWNSGFNDSAITPKGMASSFKITDEAVQAITSDADIKMAQAGYVCVSLDYKWIQLCANPADFKIPSEGPVTPTGPQLYFVGSPNGWSVGDPTLGTPTTDPAGWYVQVNTGDQFKVSSVGEGGWDGFDGGARKPKTNGGVLKVTDEAQPTVINGGDPNLVAPENGYVWVSSDYNYIQFVTSLSAIKLPTGDDPNPPTPEGAFYLVGNFSGGWDLAGTLMDKTDDGYTVTVTNAVDGAHYFCFADNAGGWDEINSARYGAGDAEIEISKDESYAITANNTNCWYFTTTEGVSYTFTVNADKTSFVMTSDGVVIPPVPTPVENLYLLGDLGTGTWALEGTKAEKVGDKFVATVSGKTGECYVTFSEYNGTWDDINRARYGSGAADVAVEPDQNYDTVKGSDKCFTFTAEANKAYTFHVAEDAKSFIMTVETIDDPVPTNEVPENLYVIGTIGQQWNTATALKLTKVANTFTADKVQVDAAEGGENGYFTFITVTGADWDAVNGGDRFGAATADQPLTSGVATPLTKYPVNVSALAAQSFVVTPGKYHIEVSFEDAAAPTVTATLDSGTGIETIAADNAAAVYYDLQGRVVLNPAAGNLYIVKRGVEVTKVLVK